MEDQTAQRDEIESLSLFKSKKMQYMVKAQNIALTHQHKYMYPQFNLFELELNRLASLPQYKLLGGEISEFNKELDDWKKRDIEIKNIFTTYHLYQNLFSRIKYISNLVFDRNEAKNACLQTAKWFFQEKPKVRNKAPDKQQAKMKPSTAGCSSESEIDTLLVSNQTKRQMKVYQSMSRTSHSEFFPPKERLIDYKRKEIVPQMNASDRQQRRAFSVSTLTKFKRYSGSLASTMASYKRTAPADLKREESKIEPVVVPFELQQVDTQKQPLDEVKQQNVADVVEAEKEKMVVQDELLQQNIVQVVHEEDANQQPEEVEDEPQESKQYQKYKLDPNAHQDMISEEQIKDVKQSTLRRILKQKEQAIKCKMQQLSIASQMLNWAAVKAKANSQAHQKSQRNLLVNRYSQMRFVPKTFEQRQTARKKQIPEYAVLYRAKSSQPTITIEEQFEQLKINNALKKYGKYINHIQIKPIPIESEEDKEEMRLMRATSLTSFCHQGKRAPFSKVIQEHGTQQHNEFAEDYALVAKQKLAKRAVLVQKKHLLGALGVADANRVEHKDPFPIQSKLLSNPFFPKHLYTAKPKKKKT